MDFEWDSKKEKSSVKKHGISFEQAKEALTCGAVVIVAYPGEEVTRIISARKATKRERLFYETKL